VGEELEATRSTLAFPVAAAILLRYREIPREELAVLNLAACPVGPAGSDGFLTLKTALLVAVDLLPELRVAGSELLALVNSLILDVLALGGVLALERRLRTCIPGLLPGRGDQVEKAVLEATVFCGEILPEAALLVALHLLQREKLAAPFGVPAFNLLALKTAKFFVALEIIIHGEDPVEAERG
jgi:hypothetical protein